MSRRQSSKRVLRPYQRIPVRYISETQSLAHLVPDLLLVLGPSLTPHLGRLDVGGALVVWFSEHAHDRDENLFHALNGRPALGGMFIVVRVISRRVENRDADGSVGVYYVTEQIVSVRAQQKQFVAWCKAMTLVWGQIAYRLGATLHHRRTSWSGGSKDSPWGT